MYAAILRFTAGVEEVETHREAHRAWLRAQYASGHFLVSGPKRPRTGGFILVGDMPRAALDEILAADGYVVGGVGAYDVIEFDVVSTAPEFAFLKPP